MARNVTLLQLRTWARQLADIESDPNVLDAELTALANRHLPEVYDRLVDAGPADYYAATTQITTTAGMTTYSIPADFRNLVAVYVRSSGSAPDLRPIFPMPEGSRGRFKAPTRVETLDVEYIPAAPTLVSDSDTFDGVSGFEELIANLMARDVMVKRESDPSVVMSNIARMEARIVARARSRDRAPKYVTDLDDAVDLPYPWGWNGTSGLACYRLRGNNLELYESIWVAP